MGFLQKVSKKEPYEALGAKNGCLAAPIVYLIAGFLVLPSVAFLSFVIVLRESLSAWGDLIVVSAVVLWPVTLFVLAWAYVAGKRADSQRGPTEAHHNYFVGSAQAGPTAQPVQSPEVKIEKPEPKSLPMGSGPWVLTTDNSSKKKVGTIRKRT